MLEKIKTIKDLKQLKVKDLPELCAEIRKKLIEEVTQSGGHLASNLGVVELSVALHYVFAEDDKIVWDVGHQSYVHKILTGRCDNFASLRRDGGISGFPDCEESDSDSFNTGHAGTAISAALGIAKARDTLNEKYKVIAVVGDGSMTCGMTYEGLNNIKDTNMLVILNDNNMSISDNVGSATLNMSKLRVGKYDKNKQKIKKALLKVPLVGKPMYKFLRWCKRRAKLGYIRNSYFDTFNLKYVGIIDGNEIKDLVYYLTKIRDNVSKPTVLHIITKKGKGYLAAENDPESFHSISVRDTDNDMESSIVVGDTICKLMENRNDIAVVCAAMAKAVGFGSIRDKFPSRFYDVGIAEEHAVTFAAGIAKGGVRPFVGIYSTFLQRSYDQILHDVALQNLPVTFLVDRAGFVGEDGKTHQGLFDLSYLSPIPNIKIWTPSTYSELSQMIEASLLEDCAVAIRYSKKLFAATRNFASHWNITRCDPNRKLAILAVGARLVDTATQIAVDGVEVVDVTTVKPLDTSYLDGINGLKILTLEENVKQGGFGQQIISYYANKNYNNLIICKAVEDRFVPHGTIEEQLAKNSMDAESLSAVVARLLND